MRDIKFDGSTSTPQNVIFSWSTIGGQIMGANSNSVVEARDTGIYILQVTDPSNGCIDRDSFHLTEDPDAISLAFYEVIPPVCHGDANASIHVLGLQGGIQPLLYKLDQGIYQSDDVFDGLKSGTYNLQILDLAGCVFDTTIVIPATESYVVNAGPDQEIYIGQSVIVTGMTDLSPDLYLEDEWDSLDIVLCKNCQEILLSPFETSTYSYKVVSKTGCILEDKMTVYVIEKGLYFIPSIFSPNGDNTNDEIRLHASPGIARVIKWVIFDRWGNAVFGKNDFDPNDQSIFWDGRTPLGGKPNPGVFPYIIEFQLINGTIEIRHGDITLLR